MVIGHKKQGEFLKKKFELNQLSHAYLFTGAKEIGKKLFAIEFIKLLNCFGEKKPCGKCVNCRMIEKNSFPDLMVVKSVNSASSIKNKKDSLEIDIGQIRDAQNFLSYKSYYGSFKSVVIDDAERMNIEAQSCFLKTLEEPKGKTMLILVTSKPDMLLSTIASRCQTVKFSRPKDLPENYERLKKEQEILKDLLPVINSDLSDKFKYVKSINFEEQELSDILEVMQKHFRNLLLAEAGIEKAVLPSTNKYSVQKLKNIINLIDNINNKLLFTNANPKLALEILLMEI
jgi:DNA polymerase III delta' subunit